MACILIQPQEKEKSLNVKRLYIDIVAPGLFCSMSYKIKREIGLNNSGAMIIKYISLK